MIHRYACGAVASTFFFFTARRGFQVAQLRFSRGLEFSALAGGGLRSPAGRGANRRQRSGTKRPVDYSDTPFWMVADRRSLKGVTPACMTSRTEEATACEVWLWYWWI